MNEKPFLLGLLRLDGPLTTECQRVTNEGHIMAIMDNNVLQLTKYSKLSIPTIVNDSSSNTLYIIYKIP